MSLKFKPVVAFDVDGVLRIDEPHSSRKHEAVCERITFREEAWPPVFHGRPPWVEGEWVSDNWFSSAGVSLLQALVASGEVDVVWATTWQGFANTYFADLFGVGELPVAVVSESYSDVVGSSSPEWKLLQLAERFPGRPLAWLDDNLPSGRVPALEELRRPYDRALTLSYSVDPYSGLTSDDVANVKEWVGLTSTVEGHNVLRERRREFVAQRRKETQLWRRKREERHKAFQTVRDKVLELFPENERLARELGSIAQYRNGFSLESVQFALTRCGVSDVDAEWLREAVRIPRYHARRFDKLSDDDSVLVF